MKTLFYYLYYRIAQAYRFCGDNYYLDKGYIVLFGTFCFIVYSIAVLISYIIDARMTITTFVLISIPFILLSEWITFFVPKERKMKKIKELEERYKNENHKKPKGWLIALYAFGTLVLYLVMLEILYGNRI